VARIVTSIRFNVLGGAQRRIDRFIAEVYRHHGPDGILARTWPTGGTVVWVVFLLGLYLFVYYL
jgi:multicomponent Na+:H+ antiporter subunit D